MINTELIQKEKHGPVDVFTFAGIKAIQVYGVHEGFSELAQHVKDHPFETIIELGADYGGLTNMLAAHEISDKAKIHTFDLNEAKFTNLFPEKITFHHADIYTNFVYISGLCLGRTLVLCDGGNKPLEFEVMSGFLRAGDMIMAHDYAADHNAYQENVDAGRWNWWEFSDANVTPRRPLKDVPVDFTKYVWCLKEVQ